MGNPRSPSATASCSPKAGPVAPHIPVLHEMSPKVASFPTLLLEDVGKLFRRDFAGTGHIHCIGTRLSGAHGFDILRRAVVDESQFVDFAQVLAQREKPGGGRIAGGEGLPRLNVLGDHRIGSRGVSGAGSLGGAGARSTAASVPSAPRS